MRTQRAYRRRARPPLPTLVGVETRERASVVTLDVAGWTSRRVAHEERVDAWLRPHLARRRAGIAHPVEDFLFSYYAQRPTALRRWHPGYGVALPASSGLGSSKGYEVSPDGTVRVCATHVVSRRPLLRSLHALLAATASRPPQLGCFGMHEWAMVYRLPQDRVRHASWPLRLGAAGTDQVVESHRISCTHFDAFRFFTDAARPRNRVQPRSDDRPSYEQPGCLHAGMDLYKHAYRLTPMVASDLVADCFELARDIRTLDMRASPYDLGGLGLAPVRVETPEGKQEYAEAQRRFAGRGAPLRQRLVEECERLLAVTP
jgi:hypothetical protein